MKILILAASALILCTGSALAAGDATAGATTFKQCAICHAIGPGAKNKIGPVLNDVIGRTAGTEAGFNYSQAMKDKGSQGLVWTPETLTQYLPKPSALVPGTKMTFAGLANPTDVANVIAYIQTFSTAAPAAGAAPAAAAPAAPAAAAPAAPAAPAQ